MSAVTAHPRAVELVERRKLRKKVERAVSRLIAILDELDTDPEAEPSLGAPELPVSGSALALTADGRWRVVPADQSRWAAGANDDREQADEDAGELDESEAEETLGWPANVSQVALGANTADGDLTAPERHGMGFVRCAGDDMEDGGTADKG